MYEEIQWKSGTLLCVVYQLTLYGRGRKAGCDEQVVQSQALLEDLYPEQ